MVLALPAPGDAAKQAHRVGVPGRAEDLIGGALLDQFAGVKHADPVAHLCHDGQVVADEQHRRGQFLAQPRDQVEDLGLDGSVERGRRLVKYQQRGLRRERHRDDHALGHAAGQLVRVPVHDPARVSDLYLAQHFVRLLMRGGSVEPGDLVHLGDLLAGLDRGVKRPARLLVHHGNGPGPQVTKPGRGQAQRVEPVDADRPGRDPAVPSEVPDQGESDRGLA